MVITIIVLLILAGVTIITLTGENGILTKSQIAKDTWNKEQEKEQIQIAVLNNTDKNGLDTDSLKNELENYSWVKNVEKEGNEEIVITGENNEQHVITKDGTIKSIPVSDYGAEVMGYTCPSSGVDKWQIFHDDGENVYLIADNYISYDNTPKSGDGSTILNKISDYQLSFYNVNMDNTYYKNGSDWIIKNSKAKKWLSNYLSEYPNSTRENILAVAYMMDTSIWSEKYAGDKAEYAIRRSNNRNVL